MRNGPYELVCAPPGYPGKRYRQRYCYEHHLVWWIKTGETLTPEEVIHHKNKKKRDNRIENLEKVDKRKHVTDHQKDRRALTTAVLCGHCDKLVVMLLRVYKTRMKQQKNGGELFCSRSCSVKHQHANKHRTHSSIG